MGNLGLQELIIIGLVVLIVISLLKKMGYLAKNDNLPTNEDKKQNINIISGTKMVIPETCPYCKNPNAKKAKLCEWCGNQIC
jgi:hypothetical protein